MKTVFILIAVSLLVCTGALAQSVAVLVVVANSARILRSGNREAAPRSIAQGEQNPSIEG